MKTIAERLKEGMEIRQLRQVDIAEKTGINKGALSSYVSGKYEPKQTNIYLLAKVLNVNEAWLMGHDVPMERKALSLNFNEKSDDTPFNRALAKLDTDKESLTEEEKQAIKDELPRIRKRIPEVFEKFANNINDMLEERLLTNYRHLNPDGKTEALKRVEELTYIPKYIDDNHLTVDAANERPGATEEEKARDDTIMNDENF